MWPNPLMTGTMSNIFPHKHGRASVALYEIFDCTHPVCQDSELKCTAQWKWSIHFDSEEANISCKGSHCPEWRPTSKLYRGLTTSQKNQVLQQTAISPPSKWNYKS